VTSLADGPSSLLQAAVMLNAAVAIATIVCLSAEFMCITLCPRLVGAGLPRGYAREAEMFHQKGEVLFLVYYGVFFRLPPTLGPLNIPVRGTVLPSSARKKIGNSMTTVNDAKMSAP